MRTTVTGLQHSAQESIRRRNCSRIAGQNPLCDLHPLWDHSRGLGETSKAKEEWMSFIQHDIRSCATAAISIGLMRPSPWTIQLSH